MAKRGVTQNPDWLSIFEAARLTCLYIDIDPSRLLLEVNTKQLKEVRGILYDVLKSPDMEWYASNGEDIIRLSNKTVLSPFFIIDIARDFVKAPYDLHPYECQISAQHLRNFLRTRFGVQTCSAVDRAARYLADILRKPRPSPGNVPRIRAECLAFIQSDFGLSKSDALRAWQLAAKIVPDSPWLKAGRPRKS